MATRRKPQRQSWTKAAAKVGSAKTPAAYMKALYALHKAGHNPRKRNAGGELSTGDARELEVYIENDSDLYRRQFQPIQKNLITKMARGVYHHAGAVKLFGYLMESGAKKYVKEFGSPGDVWHQMFNTATRKHAAERFADYFEVEAKLGNYDNYLPKKYAGWGVPNGKLVDVRVKRNGKTYRVFVTPQVARKINPEYMSTQIDTSKDFHTLTSREVDAVLAEADRQKYRKPKSAGGSRARYFYQKLQREQERWRRGR